MVPWEVWISTILVLFGAIMGVSWNVSKVAKESARDLAVFTKSTGESIRMISREVGEIRQELRDHCKSTTVPCPLHDSINKAIEANEKLVHEHQKFHMDQVSSERFVNSRTDQY